MAPLLLVAFIVVPLAEIWVIARIGHLIGLPLTLAILLLVSGLGAVLVKREGLRAWRALRAATAAGRLPGRELADAALVLAGGLLLLTPGFLTDAVGLLLVLPVTRPLTRRLLVRLAAARLLGLGRLPRGRRRARGSRVIEGEVRPGPASGRRRA